MPGLTHEQEEEFIQEYLKGKDGVFNLAKKYGTSAVTLSRLLIKNGITPRGAKAPKLDRDNLIAIVAEQHAVVDEINRCVEKEDYMNLSSHISEYKTMNTLAAELGVTEVTLRRALQSQGIDYPKIHHVRLARLSVKCLSFTNSAMDG